jgi:CDP-glucose 4,6-dehydratase
MKSDKFWKGKKVLVIGHTSFIGSWLCVWLKELGAEVIGYGPRAYFENDNYNLCGLDKKITGIRGCIKDKEGLSAIFEEYKPEIVLDVHGFQNDASVYDFIINGTLNILDCIKEAESVKSVVMALSHECYEIKDEMWGYKETDKLSGSTPYSASMASMAHIIDSFRETYFNPKNILSHNKSLGTVRIGEIIGGGDWSEEGIIPAAAKAFEEKDSVVIKNPEGIKSWLHVLEPIRGMLILAQKMYENP